MDILNENVKVLEVISAISQSTGMPIAELETDLSTCISNGLSFEDSLVYIFDHNF